MREIKQEAYYKTITGLLKLIITNESNYVNHSVIHSVKMVRDGYEITDIKV